MHLRKSEIVVLVVMLFTVALSIFFYPMMPERIASHWNAQGQVDGYMPKFCGLFLMPFVFLIIGILFWAIPRIDPLRNNIAEFRKYYDGFLILVFLFMLIIHFQIILWNFGIRIRPNIVIPIGLGLLFFYAGILCEHAKRNWFIGIRTPWTLSSDKVWDRTNRLGGRLFKIAALVALLGLFFQAWAFLFVIIPALLVAVFTIIFSYLEYVKEVKSGKTT